MAWIEAHISTTSAEVAALSDLLTQAGAAAITLYDGGDQPIYEPERDALILWDKAILIGLFDAEIQLEPLRVELTQAKIQGLLNQFEFKKVAEENWVQKSLADFKPLAFGKRLWVCPSWEPLVDPQAVNIILDPGMAFGTGTHPTTALCLEWLDRHFSDRDHTILDYGCGSGILGIASLKLGGKELYLVDHDPDALDAAAANAERNGLTPTQFHTAFPTELPAIKVDLLLANILKGPLITLAETFAKLTKPHGKLLLSGILSHQTDDLIEAYRPWFHLQVYDFKSDWVSLLGIRQSEVKQ